MLRSIKEIKNLKNKHILVRVDFNVPVKNKKVLDDSRICASIPTIEYLCKKGAKVILITHLGRPEGKVISELSLAPVARKIQALLKHKVQFLNDPFGEKENAALAKMKAGDVALFENIRFFPEEEKNDDDFTRQLASLADIFVLDGFAVAHREAASVSGVQKYIPSFAGLLLSREIEALDALLKKPKKPFVAIIGGAKIETKLPVIKNLLTIADDILVGGAIINVYYKARGYLIGESLVDAGFEKIALSLFKKKKIVLPLDVMVGNKTGNFIRVVNIGKKPHEICRKGEAILDIGPATAALYANYIKIAKTLVWNGAMGYFENRSYALGTNTVAEAMALHKTAFTLIGGGETLEAVEKMKLTKKIDFVSTAGGAMLEYLGGKKLPGLQGLTKKK
jgi:phosphoglycerate kinase